MCARFTLTIPSYKELIKLLLCQGDPNQAKSYRPRFNIAPSQDHWILHGTDRVRRLSSARWGLLNHWSTGIGQGVRQINARVETAATKPAYREAFLERRCIVPADGFYEWTGPQKNRRPLWFHRNNGALLWMAGLFEDWVPPDGSGKRRTFTILTREAQGAVAKVHDRMPVLLSPESVGSWLEGFGGEAKEDQRTTQRLLSSLGSEALVARSVSTRVNKPGIDDPTCLDPEEAPQKSLFD